MITILRSKYFGHGKTWATLSYRAPGIEPARLIFDGEYRDAAYKSPDNEDHPELAQFAFDFWHDKYGEFPDSIVKMAGQINSGNFPYNYIGIDNASIFQDGLASVCHSKQVATLLAKALGCYEKNESFLTFRFRTSDTAAYYYLLKNIIETWLLMIRKNNIDMVVTAETRNVWTNYGKTGQAILGQTAKLWDPWFKMADAVFVLDRIIGDRTSGEGKLSPFPTASLDTFNTKLSIPGVLPQFPFKNWDVLWGMASRRILPTAEDFAKIEVEAGIESDVVIETLNEAKKALIAKAINAGFIHDEKLASKQRLVELFAANGILSDDVLVRYYDCIDIIEDAVNA